VSEQHHLPEAHLVKFAEPVDNCWRRADESAVVQAEPRPAETLFGDLAHGLQGRVVGSQGQHRFHRHHDGRRVTADLVTQRAEYRQLVRHLTQRVGRDVPHVGVARHKRQGVLLTGAADDDRRAGPLHPTRFDRHVAHRVMRSGVIDSLVSEGLVKDLQRLAQPLRALSE
jgi:hypothetical protein